MASEPSSAADADRITSAQINPLAIIIQRRKGPITKRIWFSITTMVFGRYSASSVRLRRSNGFQNGFCHGGRGLRLASVSPSPIDYSIHIEVDDWNGKKG